MSPAGQSAPPTPDGERDRKLRLEAARHSVAAAMGHIFSGGLYRGPKTDALDEIAQAFAEKPAHLEPHVVVRKDGLRAERWYTEGDDCMHAWPGCSCRPPDTRYHLWVRDLGCTACGRRTPPAEEPPQKRCTSCHKEAVSAQQRPACEFCGESWPSIAWVVQWMLPCEVCKREACSTGDECMRCVYRIEQTSEAREKLLVTPIAAHFESGIGARARGKSRKRFASLTYAEAADACQWYAALGEMEASSHIARHQAEIRKLVLRELRERLEDLGSKNVRVCVACAEQIEEDRHQLGAVWASILPESYAAMPLSKRPAQQWRYSSFVNPYK